MPGAGTARGGAAERNIGRWLVLAGSGGGGGGGGGRWHHCRAERETETE